MAQISITRGLVEIKTFDDQITKAISGFTPVVVTRGLGAKRVVPASARSVEATEEAIKADYQRIKDLIARRNKVKDAIQQSNAVTMVTIGDVSMTVQQAIERKQSIKYEMALYERLRSTFANSAHSANLHNTKLDEQINTAVTQAYGNDKGKVTAEQYEAVAAPRRAEHQMTLLDPLKAEDLLPQLSESLSQFYGEVDFVLAESNARTTIEV